nr:leucine-rich repeat protein [uncultured Lachnoanaerobaculum sp.]
MYDVFISFKNTDGKGNQTEDSYIAEELYKELKSRSIYTFFSNHELEHDEWWQEICEAIEQSRILVLIGTSLDYVRAGQVKREWSLFLNLIDSGRKPGCELHAYWKDIDFSQLKKDENELILKDIHDINVLSVTELCDRIQNLLPQKSTVKKDVDTSYIPKNNKKTDRFNYRNGYTKLLGREEEIDFLKRFCTETNYPVSWTIISGKGGIGKSKLSHDFCKMMEQDGWNVFYPAHAKSFFGDDLAKTDREYLICFDYVKFELDIVESIIQLAIDRRIRYKVRFILIERNASEIIGGFSSVINEYHFPGGDLKLSAPEDEKILDIVENYITNISNDKMLGKMDKENIMSSLEMVDPGIKRPLFAMFIADAWIDNSFELEDWNRERAVDYVKNKELDRIRSAASGYAKNQADKELYLKSLDLFVLFATFCGGVDSSKIIDTVKGLTDINDHAANMLLDGSELRIKDKIKGIEPDLVGEYICINILNNLKPELVRQFFETMYKSMFIDMVSYIDKIYDDYTDPFLSVDWSSYVTSISIPLTYTYIKNNMFNGCGFIREVKLHDQVTTISKGAFRDCDHLYKINFPDNLEIIESAAFLNCVALETAMPDDGKGWVPSIVSIGDRAFKNCRKLRNIKIPRSVKEIGTEIFAKCKSIDVVELPKDITTIPHNAFEACESLVTVIFKSESRDGITLQS